MKVIVIKTPKFGENGDHVRSLQNALINKGLDPGTVDGDFGPKTKAAVSKFQKSHSFPGSGKIGPKTMDLLDLEVGDPTAPDPYKDLEGITRDFIGKTIVDIIRVDIEAKMRETDGKNRSARIDECNRRVGAAMGAAYCASMGWCAIDDACTKLNLKNPVPKTASSQAFRRTDFVPAKYIRKAGELGRIGDVGTLQVPTDKSHGHHTTLSENQLSGTKFNTAEYNTDMQGGRDGDGAYFRIRSTKNPSLLNAGKTFISFADIPQWILDHNRAA